MPFLKNPQQAGPSHRAQGRPSRHGQGRPSRHEQGQPGIEEGLLLLLLTGLPGPSTCSRGPRPWRGAWWRALWRCSSCPRPLLGGRERERGKNEWNEKTEREKKAKVSFTCKVEVNGLAALHHPLAEGPEDQCQLVIRGHDCEMELRFPWVLRERKNEKKKELGVGKRRVFLKITWLSPRIEKRGDHHPSGCQCNVVPAIAGIRLRHRVLCV